MLGRSESKRAQRRFWPLCICDTRCAADASSVVARAKVSIGERRVRMGSVHLLNMLALHVPNPLPKTVPFFQFHWENGWFHYKRSAFPRHAGRLIWASMLF